jgi:predicted DNA binding CopG/RHH family protein
MKKPTKTIAKKTVKKTVSSNKIKTAPTKAKKTIIKKTATKSVVKKASVKKIVTKKTEAKKTPVIATKSQPKTLPAAQSSRRKAISIRLLRSDIEAIKIKAEKLGVGYQTYINILIHRDATSE